MTLPLFFDYRFLPLPSLWIFSCITLDCLSFMFFGSPLILPALCMTIGLFIVSVFGLPLILLTSCMTTGLPHYPVKLSAPRYTVTGVLFILLISFSVPCGFLIKSLTGSASVCILCSTMTEYAASREQTAISDQLKTGLISQGQLLGQHQQTLVGVTHAVTELASQQANQQQQLTSILEHLQGLASANASSTANPSPMANTRPHNPSASSSGFFVCKPELYDGDPVKCSGFILQCSVYFSNSPVTTDQAKIGFIISRLSGKALEWATAVWDSISVASYTDFLDTFRSVFDHSRYGQSNGELLLALKQGHKPVATYALEFRTLAAGSGWNDAALLSVFKNGLNPDILRELACRDEALTLDPLIALSIRLDQLLSRRPKSSTHVASVPHPHVSASGFSGSTYAPESTPEPMDIQRSRLSAAERQRRIRFHLCLYCGEKGHHKAECGFLTRSMRPPATGKRVERVPRANVVRNLTPCRDSKSFSLPMILSSPTGSFPVAALVDSGSEGNFISLELVKEHNIPTKELRRPISIHAVDGKSVRSRPVTLQTVPLSLQASALHHEELSLFVLPSTEHPLILGMPWLKTHNPLISWPEGDITCILGFQPPLAPWTAVATEVPAVDDWMKRSEQVWEETHQQVSDALHQYKERSDRHRGSTPQYQPGDRVWLSTRDLRFEGECRKLVPKYIGLFKPLVPGPLAEGTPDDVPPAAVEGEASSTYAVREVLDSRRRGGVLQYLIDWEGYGPEERCWVAAGDVLDPAILAEFHARYPGKPAPRPRGRPKRSLSSSVPVRRGSRSLSPLLSGTSVATPVPPAGAPCSSGGRRRGRPRSRPTPSGEGTVTSGAVGTSCPSTLVSNGGCQPNNYNTQNAPPADNTHTADHVTPHLPRPVSPEY
uniref:CCHC-type domain-containing protein n=1 Tax=Astyanax mexicanus TaxID=7994 RepID=A0A3B1KC43_ASTMX